jgi:hypothetical protein
VYVPETHDIEIWQLEVDVVYRATAFDPTSGQMFPLGDVSRAKKASAVLSKPASISSDDWVIVLHCNR